MGEFLGGVAHGFGKSLNERAAPGGTSFIEHDAVDGVGTHLEAFDILAADVQNKIHLRIKKPGRPEVGHRFHNAGVGVEGVLNQFLPVTGSHHPADGHPVPAEPADLGQLPANQLHRVALVGTVVLV